MQLSSIFLSIICAPFLTGSITALLLGTKRRQTVTPGLLFHSISTEIIQPNLSCISKNKFKEIINRLKNDNYASVTLSSALKKQLDYSKKNILITFDDGFKNVLDHGIPLIEEAGFKSTVFCISGFIGKTSTWDIYGKNDHLDKQDLRCLSNSDHEIGSHTHTHANLTFLSTKDLHEELYTSKSILEDIIGKEVMCVSFPFGSWSNKVWDVAQSIGYTAATVYRNHKTRNFENLFPVYGVYQFDSPSSVISLLRPSQPFSARHALSSVMPHFAKGSPLWKYRRNYSLFPK